MRLPRGAEIVDAGRHHRDADDTFEVCIEGGADDDVGVRIGLVADPGRSLVNLEQRQVLAAGDGDDQAAGALDRGILDQGIGNRSDGRVEHALRAGSLAPAHHGLALLAHDRKNVGEIEIDQAFLDDEVADAGHARIEHLIGHREGVRKCGLLVGDPEQVLVRDDQQGVDLLQQLRDAGFGIAHAALALELEWLGDDADGENAELTRGPGDNRRSARAGAAAHAGGNEDHVCAGQLIADRIDGLFRCRAPHIRLRAGAEAACHLPAHLDEAPGLRTGERLCIGIGDDEVDAFEPRLDHVVDGIAAGAADPTDDDARLQLANTGHVSHCCPTIAPPGGGMRRLRDS